MGCYKIPSPRVSVISFICMVLSILQALYSWCSNYFWGRRRRAIFFQTVKLRPREATWWSGWRMAKKERFLSAYLKHQSKEFNCWGVRAVMPWISNLKVLLCKISLSGRQLSVTSSAIWPWASVKVSSYVKQRLQSTYLMWLFWRYIYIDR